MIVANISVVPFVIPLVLAAFVGLEVLIWPLLVVVAPYCLVVASGAARFSRKQESEADYIGMLIMGKDGYDI